jgi:beta-glucanase (GH16 family)
MRQGPNDMTNARSVRRLAVCTAAAAWLLASCSSSIAPPALSSQARADGSSTSSRAATSASSSAEPNSHLSLQANAPARASLTAPPKPPVLVWSDEFSGAAGAAANPAFWTPQLGGSGWGNDELECYTAARSNSALDGQGDLAITALPAPGTLCSDQKHNNYTSARLSTEGLKTFTYGTVEVRAQMPTGAGIWPAIWMLGQDHATLNWPSSGEMDISEIVGSMPSVVNGTVHGPVSKTVPYKLGNHYTMPAPVSNAFHIYAVTWTATSIVFSVDGHVYNTVTKAAATALGAWVFDQPFYLLLNVAVGGDWPGSPNASTTWPQKMLVDYVRVYQNQ